MRGAQINSAVAALLPAAVHFCASGLRHQALWCGGRCSDVIGALRRPAGLPCFVVGGGQCTCTFRSLGFSAGALSAHQ
jgi:hypothetical protein